MIQEDENQRAIDIVGSLLEDSREGGDAGQAANMAVSINSGAAVILFFISCGVGVGSQRSVRKEM